MGLHDACRTRRDLLSANCRSVVYESCAARVDDLPCCGQHNRVGVVLRMAPGRQLGYAGIDARFRAPESLGGQFEGYYEDLVGVPRDTRSSGLS